MKECDYEMLDYFLSCYFVQTFNLDELENLVYDFRFYESERNNNIFTKEIKECLSEKSFDNIRKVFKNNGLKSDDDAIKRIIQTINDKLSDVNWNKEEYKPFS